MRKILIFCVLPPFLFWVLIFLQSLYSGSRYLQQSTAVPVNRMYMAPRRRTYLTDVTPNGYEKNRKKSQKEFFWSLVIFICYHIFRGLKKTHYSTKFFIKSENQRKQGILLLILFHVYLLCLSLCIPYFLICIQAHLLWSLSLLRSLNA